MLYEAWLNDPTAWRQNSPTPAVRILVRADSLAGAAEKADAYRDEKHAGWQVNGLSECRDVVLVD